MPVLYLRFDKKTAKFEKKECYSRLTLTAPKYFLYKPWKPNDFFHFEIIINVLVIKTVSTDVKTVLTLKGLIAGGVNPSLLIFANFFIPQTVIKFKTTNISWFTVLGN